MRTRAHSLPRPLPIAILISFALALVLGALPVDAAPKGSTIKPTIVALNEIVSPGEPAAFQTSFSNTGPSTITDLFINVTVSGGTLDVPSGCTGAGTLASPATCAIGTVSSGAPPVVHLFEAIAAEPAGGIGLLTVNAVYSGDARQNNQQAAKSDTWPAVSPASTVVDTSAEVFGSWQDAHGAKNYPALIGVLQTTAVANTQAIDNAYALLIRHLDADVDCGPGPDLEGFGNAVELRVNNGNSPVEVTITYTDDADAPSPSQIEIVHKLNSGTCVFPVRDCEENPNNVAGCYDAFTMGSGQNRVTVVHALLPSNGRVKGT